MGALCKLDKQKAATFSVGWFIAVEDQQVRWSFWERFVLIKVIYRLTEIVFDSDRHDNLRRVYQASVQSKHHESCRTKPITLIKSKLVPGYIISFSASPRWEELAYEVCCSSSCIADVTNVTLIST